MERRVCADTGVGEHRQVQRQTGTHTQTDRETHSVYILYDVLEGGMGPEGGEEATLVQQGVDRQTDRYTDTDRETHSAYVLYDVLEGRLGPEGGGEAALVQQGVDRQTDRQTGTQTKTERLTVPMSCMMSWKVGWVLKGAKRPHWYSRV